jgi:hypothetical protein
MGHGKRDMKMEEERKNEREKNTKEEEQQCIYCGMTVERLE